jgi:ABC-type transport system involved in multi-copper enzyme maturation permease subunit
MWAESYHRDWALLRRDFILHRYAILPAALIFTGFEGYFISVIDHPKLWLVFTCVYMAFLTVVPISREDKYRTLAWSCSLPVSRADVVRSRFLTSWALVAVLSIVALGLAVLLPTSKVSAAMLLNSDSLLLLACVTTTVLALLLPFTIRFGFMGVLMMLVIVQILGAATFVVAKTLGGMDTVEGGVASVFRGLGDGFAWLRMTLTAPAYHLVLLCTLILVNWVSYRFALSQFRRRDL